MGAVEPQGVADPKEGAQHKALAEIERVIKAALAANSKVREALNGLEKLVADYEEAFNARTAADVVAEFGKKIADCKRPLEVLEVKVRLAGLNLYNTDIRKDICKKLIEAGMNHREAGEAADVGKGTAFEIKKQVDTE